MVDLPEVPRRFVTTEAPTDRVTPQAVAMPYVQLSKALGEIGDAADAWGTRLGQEAGAAQQVTMDAAGYPKLEATPFALGAGGRAFKRATDAGYFAAVDNKITADTADARVKFANDPAGFQTWWMKYVDGFKASLPQGSIERTALGQKLDQQGAQLFAGIKEDTARLGVASSKNALAAAASRLRLEMASLAESGGVGTDEYKAKAAEYQKVSTELGGNPLFGIGPDAAKLTFDRALQSDAAYATVGQATRLIDAGKPEQALKLADAIDKNNLLDRSEKAELSGAIRRAVKIGAAELHAEQREFMERAKPFIDGLRAGTTPWDAGELDDIEKEAGRLALVGTQTEIQSLRGQARSQPAIDALDPADKVSLAKNVRSGQLMTAQSFQSKHYTWEDFRNERFANAVIDKRLVTALDAVDDAIGKKLPLQSGYRSPEYNEKVSFSGDAGPHTTGGAVDVDVSSLSATEKQRVVSLFVQAGARGIGAYPGDRMLHIDFMDRRGGGRGPGGVAAWFGENRPYTEGPMWLASGLEDGVKNRPAGTAAGFSAAAALSPETAWSRMIYHESAGDPAAVSGKGALGLTQLMPNTAREVARRLGMVDVAGMTDEGLRQYFQTPNGQAVNLRIGRAYFDEQLAEFKDVDAAMVAYNAGPGVARQWLAANRDPRVLPAETRGYLTKVHGTDGPATARTAYGYEAQSTLNGVGLALNKSIKADVERLFPDQISILNNHQFPKEDEFGTLVDLLGLTGDTRKLAQLQDALTNAQQYRGLDGDTASRLAARLADARAAAVDGGVSASGMEFIKSMEEQQRQRESFLSKSDAMGLAEFKNRIPPQQPIDWSNSQGTLEGQLRARGLAAVTAAEYAEMPSASILKPDEQAALKEGLRGAPANTVLAALGAMKKALPPQIFDATIKSLIGNDGATLVYGAAARYIDTAPALAASLVRGQKLIEADSKIVPPDEKTRDFTTDVLPMTMFADGEMAATAIPQIEQVARARYADLSAQSNDRSNVADEARWKRSLSDVAGGLLQFNGEPIFAPAPMMEQRIFDRLMAGLTDADFAGARYANGATVTADFVRSRARLVSVADGRYAVQLGPYKENGFAQGADGSPFILDLSKRAP